MNTKHTPGNWEYGHRKGRDGMYRTEVFSAEHGGIATCEWTPKHCCDGVVSTYREANARLIAAAPDLLEALALLLSSDENIAQASEDDLCFAANDNEAEQIVREQAAAVLKARAAIRKATGVQA